ncbi:MAG: DEAD/DEAH box helicase [Phycisphaerae bacterium]|nr:DEAD/DEAH box helicase [Phycisphaerae bacterium]
MSKAELQNWLLNNSGFNIRYNNLTIDSVANQFANLERECPELQESHDWNYLLLCASLLAQSETEQCQKTALRIAQYCLECGEASTTEKHGAAIILDSLANKQTIYLAEQREFIQTNYADRIPFPLFQEWTRRSLENTITLSNSTKLEINRFQHRFWDSVKVNDWVSVSAPTSAGKSFIVGQWMSEYIRLNPQATIVYIVPTRALIQQVQRDIESNLKTDNVENVSVETLPLQTSLKEGQANVFVFTQERLHVLLAAFNNNISIDLMIVDEAQKIGDNYRGVLLQQAIEAVVCRNERCKIIYASPMTANPQILLDDSPENISSKAILSEDIMVNQNLIWASQVPRQPKLWNIEVILEDNPTKLGLIKLQSSPVTTGKRLPFIAHSLSNPNGGNVVYANGAADAEKMAKLLYDLVGDDSDILTCQDIDNLIDLINKTVHPDYSLINVLRRGIAFHYGNMPLLIRMEIERLFSINTIKYLVCTSTLIEGVNMPCQSIFVRGPQKGHNKPMNPSDFWNLAGRAGRLGKEFQGNVICIDATKENVWKEYIPKSRTKFRISRTSDEVLSNSSELLAFIDRDNPRSENPEERRLEYVFSYLVSSFIRNGDLNSSPWARRYPTEQIENLNDKVSRALCNIEITEEIILRNPGISPVAMHELLKYFNDRTIEQARSVEELIPIPAESDDAFEGYIQILHRINSHLGPVFGRGRRVGQIALLIVDWMRGYPLSRIIANRKRHYESKETPIKLPALIRNTMKDVEEFARFQAPKYLSCYINILQLHFQQIERQDLNDRLMDVNILLEFGVSQATQLSLIGIGLSRSSAIYVSEFIANDSLNESECLSWLNENNWMANDMPELIKAEISTVLENKRY